jgi:hypothetical protein
MPKYSNKLVMPLMGGQVTIFQEFNRSTVIYDKAYHDSLRRTVWLNQDFFPDKFSSKVIDFEFNVGNCLNQFR